MNKLKQRWGVTSNRQLLIIFFVFAITGSTSAWFSRPICNSFGLTSDDLGIWFTPVRLLLIFPIYQILLLLFGFIFGQIKFFWAFEKKMLRSLSLGFFFKEEKN